MESINEDVSLESNSVTVSSSAILETQGIISQPIIILSDIHTVASEIVIGDVHSDAEDLNSIASDSSRPTSPNTREVLSEQVSQADENVKLVQTDEEKNVSRKRTRSESENEDDGQTCPICLDNWTNSGDHRVCSLKCGHLFGNSCIVRWLQSQSKKSCPTCKKKVMKNDMRFIYARKLVAVDTAELEEMRNNLETVMEERNKLQLELTKYRCREHTFHQEISVLKSQLSSLKTNYTTSSTISNMLNQNFSQSKVKLYMDKSLDICQLGGCRVCAVNSGLDLIMASVKSPNNLFAGYGLRKISITQYRPLAFLPLHSSQIRDISFQNVKVLTVSMDKTFKITDSVSNANVCSLSQSIPLWSCTWDLQKKDYFYIGTQAGSVLKYDLRNPTQPVCFLAVPGDMSPVVSVAHIPNEAGSLRTDGVVSCKLNSIWFFENTSPEYSQHPIMIDGPLYSMKYDPVSKLFLVSSRPNQRNPNPRHTLANLEIEDDKVVTKVVQTFESSGLQKHLSRSCFINNGNEYIAAHEESSKVVSLWNIHNGMKVASVPVHEAVLDLNAVTTASNNLLVGLTERKMQFYKFA